MAPPKWGSRQYDGPIKNRESAVSPNGRYNYRPIPARGRSEAGASHSSPSRASPSRTSLSYSPHSSNASGDSDWGSDSEDENPTQGKQSRGACGGLGWRAWQTAPE